MVYMKLISHTNNLSLQTTLVAPLPLIAKLLMLAKPI